MNGCNNSFVKWSVMIYWQWGFQTTWQNESGSHSSGLKVLRQSCIPVYRYSWPFLPTSNSMDTSCQFFFVVDSIQLCKASTLVWQPTVYFLSNISDHSAQAVLCTCICILYNCIFFNSKAKKRLLTSSQISATTPANQHSTNSASTRPSASTTDRRDNIVF